MILDKIVYILYGIDMSISAGNIIPVTKARAKLGDLADSVRGDNYIVLTKAGSAKAAIVDINYLTKLEKEVQQVYRKTFIDPKFFPYTRDFSKEEMDEWLKEDAL